MLLFSTWFGTFVVEDGEVLHAVLAPQDPEALARRMLAMEERKVLPEERTLAKKLEDFSVPERRLRRLGGSVTRDPPPFLDPQQYGFAPPLLREAMIVLGKLQLKRAVQPVDHLIQALRSLDDVTQTFNVLLERLRDWYSLHFPELPRMVDGPRFLELVAVHGRREEMPLDSVESVGADLDADNQAAVQAFARLLRDLHQRRTALEAYLEEKMAALAPNIAHLVGPILGARLLSYAGGLEEMARMPSSTIQLLGAEKALFRHLKKGTKPPKHGVLLQHPWVHQAPYWQRGAIARGMASKLAIAARADAYSGRFLGEELRADVEALRAKVAKTHQKPPKRPRRGRRPHRRR